MTAPSQTEGCAVCGHPKTVNSHVIPRALAREIRADCKDLTILSSGVKKPKFSQSGLVDRALLCSAHEAITGELDRYGVDFIRRVRKERNLHRDRFQIDNPEPGKLLRFATSIVWRAVVSAHGNANRDDLGPLEKGLERNVFEGVALNAQLFVSSVSIQHDERELLTAMMPVRSRQAGAWAWVFTLNGCFFALFLGSPNFAFPTSETRADLLTRPTIARLQSLDAMNWGGLNDMMKTIGPLPERRGLKPSRG
jgi:hypothetical protein